MDGMLKVKDIRRLTGLTGAEIAWFHHQKVVEAAAYSTYSVEGNDGYKLFNRSDLPKFQQIAMYYELGLRRDEIRDIMTAKDYDVNRALEDLYWQLREKRDRLERHMVAIEHLQKLGAKGHIMDYLQDIDLEELGRNYQKLQSEPVWAEFQAAFAEIPGEDFLPALEDSLRGLSGLDPEDLKRDKGSTAAARLVTVLREHLGLIGYTTALGIATSIPGGGTEAANLRDALGTELTIPQAEAIQGYLEKDRNQFFRELVNLIVEYHNYFGGAYDEAPIRSMVDDVKALAKAHFGISREIEYRLFFTLLPPKPSPEKSDYLGFIYNALYFYHEKDIKT